MKKSNDKIKIVRQQTIEKILDGSIPDKDVVATLYDTIKYPSKPLYDSQ